MECLSDCRFLKLKHEGTLNTLFLSLEMTVYQVNPILCQCWQPQDTVMVLSKSNPWQTTGLRMNCSLVDCQVVLTQNTTVVPQYLTNNDRIYPSTFLHDSWDSELRAMENIWNQSHSSYMCALCTCLQADNDLIHSYPPLDVPPDCYACPASQPGRKETWIWISQTVMRLTEWLWFLLR